MFSDPRALILAAAFLAPLGSLSSQGFAPADSGQRARARALCGPLADDSIARNLLWIPPPDAVVSVRVDGLTPPEILVSSTAIPEYPANLRRQGIQGRVIATAIVDTAGRVERGSVKVSVTPHEDFIPAVRRYLEMSRFSVGQRHGRPMRVCVVLPIDFRVTGN